LCRRKMEGNYQEKNQIFYYNTSHINTDNSRSKLIKNFFTCQNLTSNHFEKMDIIFPPFPINQKTFNFVSETSAHQNNYAELVIQKMNAEKICYTI